MEVSVLRRRASRFRKAILECPSEPPQRGGNTPAPSTVGCSFLVVKRSGRKPCGVRAYDRDLAVTPAGGLGGLKNLDIPPPSPAFFRAFEQPVVFRPLFEARSRLESRRFQHGDSPPFSEDSLVLTGAGAWNT